MDAVFVDDVLGAMAALGRAPFRALVVLAEQRNAAVPMRTLLRVARHRHPDIGLVVLRAPGRTLEIAAPYAEELALDATDDDVATAAFEAGHPPGVDEKTAPVPVAAGPLLEGTLAGAGGPAVIASLFAQELTGRLHVDDGAAKGVLYFAGGEPVAVDAENPRADPRGPNEVLAELRAGVRARVLALIEQPAGAYSFVEDQGFLDVRLLTKVSPFGLILDVRRKNTTPASLLSLHAEMAQKFVAPAVGLERAGKRLGAFTRDKNIADVVGSGSTVEAVLSALGLDPLMGTLVMLTLVDARLISLHDAPPAEASVALGEIDAAPNPFTLGDNSVMVTEGEAEQIARLYVEMKPATDPKVVLGVKDGASTAEIEEAYRSRMAALHRDGVGVDQRLDELRRKADQARSTLLAETAPIEPAPKAETIGRYEIMKRIGQGGMAEVFLGRQVGLHGFEKRVVIKRILPQWADDLEVVRMFLEEARIAARITHPNVVQIYDLGESDGQYYIVMEHVDGPNFDKLIDNAKKLSIPMPFEIAAAVVSQACAGLHAAHAHRDDAGRAVPIIHRDVSTQNILVASDGHVKLTDFGVAKRADALDRTMPGILKGKPHYLAPEYIQGAPADARSDVFAAGLVLYVALTGVHPFERMTPDESMRAVLASSYPSVDKLRLDIPRALAHVVERALAVRVDQRFQTAHALQLALESFAAATGKMTTPAALASFVQQASGTKPKLTASVRDAAPVADPSQVPFEEKTLELVWPFSR
jgi:serine/threonine-protein kinase